MDPRDPDVLLAAAYQRRRHVWTLIDGGPESALHKSTDGGKTWSKLTSGLPKDEMGRIGLAISPADPDVVYAARRDRRRQQVGGHLPLDEPRRDLGEARRLQPGRPKYYQKVFVDPKNADRVYSMDIFLQVTDDGGKTWRNLGERYKHVDNHAIWIDPDDTDHYLVGCDGGLYESFDRGGHLGVHREPADHAVLPRGRRQPAPVYNVYGGTQDNYTLGGPSRTLTEHGVMNSDWFVTWGGDGFQARVDPSDPNIVYAKRSTACSSASTAGAASASSSSRRRRRATRRCAGTGTPRS